MDTVRALLAIAIAAILLFPGCTGNQGNGLTEEDVAKLLNGTDRKNISVDIIIYHGEECPHCKRTISMLGLLNNSYDIGMTLRETWHDETNAKELESVFNRFGVDPGMRGVPVSIVNGKMMAIGELSLKNWVSVLDECGAGNCRDGVFYEDPQTGNLVKG